MTVSNQQKITPKVQSFIDHYIQTGHGEKSAIIAGYSAKTARSKASQLLTKVNIVQLVVDGLREKSKDVVLDANFVKNEAYLLHQRATLARQVVNRKGQVQFVEYDPTTAHKALKMIGEHKDVAAFDNTVKFENDKDNPVGMIALGATDRAARVADLFRQALVDAAKEVRELDDDSKV